MSAKLEHVNVTVTEPTRTADMMCALFDWRVRWRGPSMGGGQTVHVGTDDAYLAIYSGGVPMESGVPTHKAKGGLNHIGIVVSDLDAVEQRVLNAGYRTFSHADYDPGRRFYFHDNDGIEFEVVSYAPAVK